MSVQYDFYKNPSPKDSKKRPRYHARVVPYGTTDTKRLAEKIHARCTATPADVAAVLSSLTDVIVEELSDGNRVYIEGLGYLQIVPQCPSIQSTKEIRAESIHFKTVSFRPEIALKGRLRTVQFERALRKNHSSNVSPEQTTALLRTYFAEHDHMTRTDFQRICWFTTSTANRRLKDLVECGKLSNIGAKRAPLYIAGENLQGSQEGTKG
ncbi:MAG: HU family DNA-binding protein [Parabacteroides sp.]|nr:HU family DNA-binding protein [Parabacteroides sp.]